MKKYLIISIDTEGDWFKKRYNSNKNICAIPWFHELVLKYNFSPTYLITYEIATREEPIGILKPYLDRGECEIGHHLHVSTTPPFESVNKYGIDESCLLGIQSELNNELFHRKMESLHNAIIENFGIIPRSHRAGRWAVDKRTLLWLEKNNYLVDSSICPHKSWNYYTKGYKDYIKTNTFKAPNYPYFPAAKVITKEATGLEDRINILEVPVTGIHLDYFSNYSQKTMILLTVLLNKLGSYKFGNISFRPSYNINIGKYERLLRKLFESDISIFNFMFHSNELAVGTSPFSKSQKMCNKLLNRIEFVFRTAKEYGINGIFLSDVAKKNK